MRVIDAEITIFTAAGRRSGHYRLVTTLLDEQRYPAAELVRLSHERWEIETAYLELKSSMINGRVLRARTPGRDRAGSPRAPGHLPADTHRVSSTPPRPVPNSTPTAPVSP